MLIRFKKNRKKVLCFYWDLFLIYYILILLRSMDKICFVVSYILILRDRERSKNLKKSRSLFQERCWCFVFRKKNYVKIFPKDYKYIPCFVIDVSHTCSFFVFYKKIICVGFLKYNHTNIDKYYVYSGCFHFSAWIIGKFNTDVNWKKKLCKWRKAYVNINFLKVCCNNKLFE